VPETAATARRLIAAMGAMIDEIIAAEGVFRVPKDAGCFALWSDPLHAPDDDDGRAGDRHE